MKRVSLVKRVRLLNTVPLVKGVRLVQRVRLMKPRLSEGRSNGQGRCVAVSTKSLSGARRSGMVVD
jgi:hypothetical protein